MLAHTASFLKLINSTIEDTSRGVASAHHLDNVRCGVENIISLLQCDNGVIEKADQLTRRAESYITYHGLVTSNISGVTIGEDGDRLRALREALDDFHSAVERSRAKPQSAQARHDLRPISHVAPSDKEVVLRAG